MDVLDREKIFNGTPQKIFDRYRKELETAHSDETALKFYNSYKDQPLSFIMKNSRQIFSEMSYGYDFYIDIVRNHLMNPLLYRTEIQKVKGWRAVVSANHYPVEKIDELISILEEKDNQTRNTQEVLTLGISAHDAQQFQTEIFDMLYDCYSNGKTPDSDYLNIIADGIFSSKCPYTKMALGVLFVCSHDEYLPYLHECSRVVMQRPKIITNDWIERAVRTMYIIRTLMKDGYVNGFVCMCGNRDFRDLWLNISKGDDVILNEITRRTNVTKANMIKNMSESTASDIVSFSEELDDLYFEEDAQIMQYDEVCNKLAYYEAVENYYYETGLVNSDPNGYENVMDISGTLQAAKLYLEWEDDGSPNKVIASHIKTRKEREAEELEKESKKTSLQKTLSKSLVDTVGNNDFEIDYIHKTDDLIKEVESIANMDDEDAAKEKLSIARSDYNNLKKQLDGTNFTSAKEHIKSLEEVLNDVSFDFEESGLGDFLKDPIFEDAYPSVSSLIPFKNAEIGDRIDTTNIQSFMGGNRVDRFPRENDLRMIEKFYNKWDKRFVPMGKMKAEYYFWDDTKNPTDSDAITKRINPNLAFTKSTLVYYFYKEQVQFLFITKKMPKGAFGISCLCTAQTKRYGDYYYTYSTLSNGFNINACNTWIDEMLDYIMYGGRRGFESAEESGLGDFSFLEEKDEDDEDEKETNEKPKKPKESLLNKVQNKALDHAAKQEQKASLMKEKLDKVKTTAKAVLDRPKRNVSAIEKTFKDFDKMDENRRKEFLLKPGYRHKIFKSIKTALLYGSAAQVKLAYVPLVAILRHGSKSKDKRIRNELSMELDTEIKICETKIDDAAAAGDNEKKYQLMRIHDKLVAERTRVRLNSKYV